jgi:hypothetical protein
MAYTKEKKDECFDCIISEIESGKSLTYCLNNNGMPSTSTFYIWLEEDESFSKRYARACEFREMLIFDEILTIADKQGEDVKEVEGVEVINHNVINRNRLQIDARKWMLGKMNPKKYGDKVDVTTDGEKIQNISIPLVLSDGRTYDDLIKELKPE